MQTCTHNGCPIQCLEGLQVIDDKESVIVCGGHHRVSIQVQDYQMGEILQVEHFTYVINVIVAQVQLHQRGCFLYANHTSHTIVLHGEILELLEALDGTAIQGADVVVAQTEAVQAGQATQAL